MPRSVWKGAIAFGLVNVPVALYPASGASRLDLDLLDRRDFAPVGYQRVNKRTGEAVPADEIVKGYEYEKGECVVVGDEDFRQANVRATQTLDLFCFVEGRELPTYYFDTPYYLEPGKGGAKGYALLRETLRATGRVGIGTVVIRTRQHLAALVAVERVLLLNTLRFADEIRSVEDLELPGDDLRAVRVSDRELEMARRLVDEMTEAWRPERYHDTYREDLLARIRKKAEAGKTHEVAEAAEEQAPGGEVVDLMGMLKRSLEARQPGKGAGAARGKPGKERQRKGAAEARRRRA